MRTNTKAHATNLTFEGTIALRTDAEQQLRRAVMTCLLWEDGFYENGVSIADRIKSLVPKVSPEVVASIAISARKDQGLRHVPLLLIRELARTTQGKLVSETLAEVINRPDEITEFLSIYWADGRQPLSKQVKLGLAAAFPKFSSYSLAKYSGKDKAVKLRDALFLCHAKPKDAKQAAVWKKLVDGTLEAPDTWEVALSGGADKAETFTRLIKERKLGGLAMLRNLRNMIESGVDRDTIREGLRTAPTEWVLPFRFVAAAKYAPAFEPELEAMMLASMEGATKFAGKTALVIDTSPSMWADRVSHKSDMSRFDAAAGLAILARELCEEVAVYAFNEKAYIVPPRTGFALRDALAQTRGSASCGGYAVQLANKEGYDRIIVLTDGQWHATMPGADPLVGRANHARSWFAGGEVSIPKPLTDKAYMINMHAYQNGVGSGAWTTISGWSEHVLRYIKELEQADSMQR